MQPKDKTHQPITDTELNSWSGWPMIAVTLAVSIWTGYSTIASYQLPIGLICISVLLVLLSFMTLYIQRPYDARAFEFFGDYLGTDKSRGLRQYFPLTSAKNHNRAIFKIDVDPTVVLDANRRPGQTQV